MVGFIVIFGARPLEYSESVSCALDWEQQHKLSFRRKYRLVLCSTGLGPSGLHRSQRIGLAICSIRFPDRRQIFTLGGKVMKKALAVFALILAFAAGAVVSAQVRDWHDLGEVRKHVNEAIHEMERARAANHYDMKGHGARAEEHLRAAERELGLAIDASKATAR